MLAPSFNLCLLLLLDNGSLVLSVDGKALATQTRLARVFAKSCVFPKPDDAFRLSRFRPHGPCYVPPRPLLIEFFRVVSTVPSPS